MGKERMKGPEGPQKSPDAGRDADKGRKDAVKEKFKGEQDLPGAMVKKLKNRIDQAYGKKTEDKIPVYTKMNIDALPANIKKTLGTLRPGEVQVVADPSDPQKKWVLAKVGQDNYRAYVGFAKNVSASTVDDRQSRIKTGAEAMK